MKRLGWIALSLLAASSSSAFAFGDKPVTTLKCVTQNGKYGIVLTHGGLAGPMAHIFQKGSKKPVAAFAGVIEKRGGMTRLYAARGFQLQIILEGIRRPGIGKGLMGHMKADLGRAGRISEDVSCGY